MYRSSLSYPKEEIFPIFIDQDRAPPGVARWPTLLALPKRSPMLFSSPIVSLSLGYACLPYAATRGRVPSGRVTCLQSIWCQGRTGGVQRGWGTLVVAQRRALTSYATLAIPHGRRV